MVVNGGVGVGVGIRAGDAVGVGHRRGYTPEVEGGGTLTLSLLLRML